MELEQEFLNPVLCPLNYPTSWNSLYVSNFPSALPKILCPYERSFCCGRVVKLYLRVLACSEVVAKWAGNWQTEQSSTPGFPVREDQALLCVTTCTNSNQFPPHFFFLFKLILRFSACLPWSLLSNRFRGAWKIPSGTDLKFPLSAYIDFVQCMSSFLAEGLISLAFLDWS